MRGVGLHAIIHIQYVQKGDRAYRAEINNLKMQKAIEMMQYGKISETKAALKLGYSDLQTFNKAFRRTMGCSPVTFINEQAQEPQSDGK